MTTHALALPTSGGKNDSVQHQASETVLHDIRVLAVDQKLDSKGGEAIVAQSSTRLAAPTDGLQLPSDAQRVLRSAIFR